MKKIINILVGLVAAFSYSQNYKGNLEQVKNKGLHNVLLSPEVRSACQNNLSYFRILDASHNEVPYALTSNKVGEKEDKIIVFPMVSNVSIPNKSTSVVIENVLFDVGIQNLTLSIANSDVVKKYNILGSDDSKEWFGLVENQILSEINANGASEVEKNFSFPLCNYKFLKFEFIDKNSLPIKVVGAGYKTPFYKYSSKTELEGFEQKITTNKSEKKTIICLKFKTPQVIDGLKFDINAPGLYLRQARILASRSTTVKGKTSNYSETLAAFELNSKVNNQFEFPELFEKNITIEIDNQDNPPLEIKSIKLLQTPLNLIADLDTKEYEVIIDSTLQTPNYDLANFESNFNKVMPQIGVVGLTKIADSKAANGEKSFWQTPVFMWICIVLAVLIIGYFALGLLKDMSKE